MSRYISKKSSPEVRHAYRGEDPSSRKPDLQMFPKLEKIIFSADMDPLESLLRKEIFEPSSRK
jgi:hypothetical protein